MKITLTISGKVGKRANKKDMLNYGKTYIAPINTRGMEIYAEFEGAQDQIDKQISAFLRDLAVKPSGRTKRYIARKNDKECFYLSLESYKVLAPYMRKFGYLA